VGGGLLTFRGDHDADRDIVVSKVFRVRCSSWPVEAERGEGLNFEYGTSTYGRVQLKQGKQYFVPQYMCDICCKCIRVKYRF